MLWAVILWYLLLVDFPILVSLEILEREIDVVLVLRR